MLGMPAFLLGAAVGSLLNLAVDRLPRGQPLLVSRSRSDACETALAPANLVPVLSYLGGAAALFLVGLHRCGRKDALLGGNYIAAWYVRLVGGFAL